MKCPYLITTKHMIGQFPQDSIDIEEFGSCIQYDCPFYNRVTNELSGIKTEHCRKADYEVKR